MFSASGSTSNNGYSIPLSTSQCHDNDNDALHPRSFEVHFNPPVPLSWIYSVHNQPHRVHAPNSYLISFPLSLSLAITIQLVSTNLNPESTAPYYYRRCMLSRLVNKGPFNTKDRKGMRAHFILLSANCPNSPIIDKHYNLPLSRHTGPMHFPLKFP